MAPISRIHPAAIFRAPWPPSAAIQCVSPTRRLRAATSAATSATSEPAPPLWDCRLDPQPPALLARAAATQSPGLLLVSHTDPAAQSDVIPQTALHVPVEGSHRYGAHGVTMAVGDVVLLASSEQVPFGAGLHFPPSHTKPAAQSVAATQLALQFVVPSQEKLPAHAAGARQPPVLSQTATFPSVHPGPHEVPTLGYAHAAMFVPSH